MKISSRQYARGLYESLAGKSEKEAKVIIKNFVTLLGRNRELTRAADILAIFAEIWDAEHGLVTAKLTSARDLGSATRATVSGYLKDRTGAEKIDLVEEIDSNLLGGFILEYQSKVLDGSLKTSLVELKNKISS